MVSGDISPEFGSPYDIGCGEVGAAPLKGAVCLSGSLPGRDFVG